MEDKIKEEFLTAIHNRAEQMYQESLQKIEGEFEEEMANIAAALLEAITQGLESYQKLETEGNVGVLSYVYVSFLRTSILFDVPGYRLDFYDEKNRISLVECAFAWEFNYIFRYLKNIKIELSKLFEKQTRVPGYELDYILYDWAEVYKKLADKKIEPILRFILEQEGVRLLSGKSVKFFRGDFFDRITPILQWDKEYIKMQEGNKDVTYGV